MTVNPSARKNIVRRFLRLWFHLYELKIHGLKNIPYGVPKIGLINHQNFLDSQVCGLYLDGIALGKKDLWDGILGKLIVGPWLDSLGGVPFDRFAPTPSAAKQIFKTLNDGGYVGYAPEATRFFGCVGYLYLDLLMISKERVPNAEILLVGTHYSHPIPRLNERLGEGVPFPGTKIEFWFETLQQYWNTNEKLRDVVNDQECLDILIGGGEPLKEMRDKKEAKLESRVQWLIGNSLAMLSGNDIPYNPEKSFEKKYGLIE